jgi:hypothetical protein
MTKEDIIRMAREAGGYLGELPLCDAWLFVEEEHLQRFAALVAAAERDKWEAKFKQLEALMQVREQQPNKPCCLAEREACAKVCDVRAVQDGWEGCYADECAAEIRARGQQ